MTSASRRETTFDAADLEWPTWLLLIATYAGWIVLTLSWSAVPGWLLWLLAGYTIALHSSLQHEIIHGHPTRNPRLNLVLGWPPLTLWLPLELYRENHVRHHDSDLTDPDSDPESYYLTPAKWQALKSWQQRVLLFNNSFAGRMLIGPLLAIGQTWRDEFLLLLRGDYRHAGMLLRHALSVAALCWWLIAVCGMPLYLYLLAFVWPASSMMMMRSFLEHRYDPDASRRTVLVDGCPLTRLLFLNNNYHWVHHHFPGLAWYRIPSVMRERRREMLEKNGDYRFPGYWNIARRYLFRPWTHPAYPS
jgi:fatty acid desaturase